MHEMFKKYTTSVVTEKDKILENSCTLNPPNISIYTRTAIERTRLDIKEFIPPLHLLDKPYTLASRLTYKIDKDYFYLKDLETLEELYILHFDDTKLIVKIHYSNIILSTYIKNIFNGIRRAIEIEEKNFNQLKNEEYENEK